MATVEPSPSAPPPRGWCVARLGSVRVHLRASALVTLAMLWVVLYAQLTSSLAWRAGWLAPTLTTLACLAFLLSVILHELGHAVAARGLRLPVVAVTVFHLGGRTQLGRDPDDPRDEALIAVAGPVVSLLLAGILLAGGMTLGVRTVAGSLLVFLGYLNGAIGVLNLLPGHPLDGGIMVRAAAWSVTGDAVGSLRVSGVLGQALGGAMVVGGVLGAVPGGLGASEPAWLWLAVIGGFVAVAARIGMIQAEVRVRLEGVRTAELSREVAFDVAVHAPIGEVAAQVGAGSTPGLVLDRTGTPVGTLGPGDVAAVPTSSWDRITVVESMQPLLGTVDAEEEVLAVLSRFRRTRESTLAVLAEGRPVGLLLASDVLAHLDEG